MRFFFIDVILLRHQHVSANPVDICSVVRTRIQMLFVFLFSRLTSAVSREQEYKFLISNVSLCPECCMLSFG